MALKERLLEKIVKTNYEHPQEPAITNKEAIEAQNELNSQLNRKDISSNALPTNEGKILTILIHGYLSSKWLWIDPFFGTFGWLRDYRNDPKPRSYGWHQKPPPSYMYVPFDISTSPVVNPEGVFNTLIRKGYEVLTYSQMDSTGDIDIAARELEIILQGVRKTYGKRRIIIVGHSRGGICIRRYLDLCVDEQIEKVITLASPHYGTNYSNIKIIKEPAIKILNDVNIKKLWDIKGIREVNNLLYEQMALNSDYLLSLKDRENHPKIEYISAGGTSSVFAHIYTWSMSKRYTKKSTLGMFNIKTRTALKQEERVKRKPHNSKEKEKQYHWIAQAKKIFTIFSSGLIPELKFGDGLVGFKSTILKDAIRKYSIDANHEEMAVCDKVKKLILKELKLSTKKI